ncbi:DNA repair protein RecO [Desulforhabdus amnigena]|jgi:DNA repair protein RecO (recombination protein O)|uniref:DNA repair protein RecO n=1 Tax=Desulforhabdus amnigena TaxID=40218 RepID=A0A9W6FW93_9BACT|nr:DNA repair protein RecO [Desulforhabdus amnigena]NLJ26733.1 DNA repair protein RecO [Deltaproteobacteria bacterium]GLI36009.1 DNA repair protein RecO [Desulforhabdus amnigena]
MKICETEAIVLHTRDYGESDRLITFYSKAAGKLRGIAKGARRSRKRFVHAFEPCSLVLLTYRERKSLLWVEACKLLEPYLALTTEVERWGYAALVSEILLEMTPEGDEQEELFYLLTATLGQLTESRDPLNVMLLFLIRFMDMMGYLPELQSCSICRCPIRTSARWAWRLKQGTLACQKHRFLNDDHLLLDAGTLILIQQVRSLTVDKIWRLHFLQEKKAPLFYGLMDWIRDLIRKELKSLKLLEQVQSACGFKIERNQRWSG